MTGLIDPTPVKAHIVALLDAGMTYVQIADAADLSENTIRYMRDRRFVQAKKAARILAVRVPERGVIDAERADHAHRIVHSDAHRHAESVRILDTEQRLGDWRDRAACRNIDTATFYRHRGESIEDAREVCRRCPVRAECLDYALSTGQKYGVWGGMSERQRRLMKARAS